MYGFVKKELFCVFMYYKYATFNLFTQTLSLKNQ